MIYAQILLKVAKSPHTIIDKLNLNIIAKRSPI